MVSTAKKESPAWRRMTADDLPAVEAIAAEVHPAYPEEPAIFLERFELFPDGCFVLVQREAVAAYVVSHPWRAFDPPPLNKRIGSLPSPGETFYIHDLAMLPAVRGRGYANMIVGHLVGLTLDLEIPTMSLVAVNESVPFWSRYGFEVVRRAKLDRLLASYGGDAVFMCRQASSRHPPLRIPARP